MHPAAGTNDSQVPCTQTSFVAHAFWQLPQCSGSLILSTQPPLHSLKPPVQSLTQFDCWHKSVVPEHAVLPPQCCGLLVGSMQLPWASWSPGRHVHEPLHHSPFAHWVVQPPQWSGSWATSAQDGQQSEPLAHAAQPALSQPSSG